MAESRSRDGSTPCRRVFRGVGSVPGLMKEAYRPERAEGAKFRFLCVGEDKGGKDNHALETRANDRRSN